MAKRNYSGKRTSKIEPAVMTLTFNLTTVLPNTYRADYIDLSQVASLVNRRFYRQGLNWSVAGFKFTSTSGNAGLIGIGKLPNSWVMANAWEKSMRTWNKMNRESLAETESIRPKFLDFKIYADAGHHAVGYGANLLPYANGPSTAVPGEWISSKAVVPFGPASPGNTAEFEFVAVGANFPGAGASGLNAVSLIEGYAASRGLPYNPDPNTPADADDADGSTPENWMAAIFNEGTDQTSEILEDMIFDNNQPPYPFEGDGVSIDTMYPNGANQMSGLEIHDISTVSGTTVGAQTRAKGGNFPCGLIQVGIGATAEGTGMSLTLQVDLIPGHHRGYLCESMTEM